MKHTRRLRVTCATLLLAVLTLPACSRAATAEPPSHTAPSADASLRAHWEARIAELERDILALRESDYILRAEYETRIKSLLSEIDELEARLALLDTPPEGSDLPVSGNPADPPADTPTPPDKAPSMAFHYEIRDGRAVILAYLGSQPRVTIPLSIEGYPVVEIADNAFRGTSVVSVELPYSVTRIGWFSFAGCLSLAQVTLPASVESIGYGAFDGCPYLTVLCPADSYAADFAVSFGLAHEFT